MPPDLFDEPGSARTPRRRRVPSAMRGATGRLRIGDDWNAITIIALSQSNPLKAIAEFVENSIDAGARHITVTDSLLPESKDPNRAQQGLPGYTYYNAPGELWRSRFDAEQNVIVINNGHRDFVYASRGKSVKLRYLTRLFAKEMVQKNFPGLPADQLLERMIELSLYTEEHLR